MAKSGTQIKILYGEGDAEVLASQAAALQKAGHNVSPALGRKGVEDALRGGQFDLVVLGSSMSKNDRHHLPYMVKKASDATRVLVMHADGGRHPRVDAFIDTGRSLDALLETIASLMGKPAAMAAAAGR